MRGLLDVLNSGEGRLGLGLLAAGMPSTVPTGQRLQQVMQGMDDYKANELKSKFMGMQMQNYESEIEARKLAGVKDARQQAMIAEFMNGGAPAGASEGVGLLGSQGARAIEGGAQPAPQQGAGGVLALARQMGIPEKAIQADMAFNGGKGIAAMLEKHGARDMQVSNGYAYDKNAMGAGFMPSLSTSQDGKTSMVQIGQDGQPVISAPKGALDTFNSYAGAAAALKPIEVYNPATGRKEFTNERNVASGGGQPAIARSPMQGTGPGYAGGSAQNAAGEQIRMMQSELARLPSGHPDRAAVEREIQRLGGSMPQEQAAPASIGYAAGPSASEAAAAAAAQAGAVDTAKAGVVQATAAKKLATMAGENISNADRAMELLQLGPTASGLGEISDKASAFFGKPTPGGNIAAQLDVIAAGMVKNVPRFEGPQSDKDVDQYKAAAGRLGDRGVPVEQRIQAAKEIKRLAEKAAGQQSGDEKPAPKLLPSLPPANSANKGKRIRDTTTGKILRSNGMQWTEE